MTAKRPDGTGFIEAGTLGVCYLSAHLALVDHVGPGATVYIPGGGGGVGHLAIQKAKALGARLVISSGGNAQSRALASKSGGDHVFDYRHDDIPREIGRLTDGQGVDLVFDATYSEESFVATSNQVRPGGRWIVLGVGPGKTSRRTEQNSPVAGILAGKSAQLINLNLLRYFSEPGALDDAAKTRLKMAIQDAATSVKAGAVRPHVSETITSEPDAINAALADMKAGRKSFGKVAVVVDEERAR